MATRQYEFVTGPTTSELPASGDPSDDGDLVPLGYADDHYVQGKAAAADVAAVKAIAAAVRSGGDLVYCVALDTIFYFASASVAAGDDVNVIVPTSGSGRWIKVKQGVSGSLVGTSDAQNLSTKKLDQTCTLVDSSDNTKAVGFGVSGATTGTKTTLTFAQTANRTVTFPDATDTLVGKATTDDLSNKKLKADTVKFADPSDTSKLLAFSLSGITTATTRTITIPNVSGTMTLIDASQDLSNKTLITPIITTPSILGAATITGGSDVKQLTIVGNGTQTDNILECQTSTTAAVLTVSPLGAITAGALTGGNGIRVRAYGRFEALTLSSANLGPTIDLGWADNTGAASLSTNQKKWEIVNCGSSNSVGAEGALVINNATDTRQAIVCYRQGHIGFPTQSRFRAYKSADSSGIASGNSGDITFDTEVADIRGEYNNSNGKYIPSLSGTHLLGAFVAVSPTGGSTVTQLAIYLRKNGTRVETLSLQRGISISSGAVLSGNVVPVEATASDEYTISVNVVATGGGGQYIISFEDSGSRNTAFWGYKIA